MTQIRIEFITLGLGGWAQNVIKALEGDAQILTVTTTATAPENCPLAPTRGDRTCYARLTPVGGTVYATKGKEPVANLANSIRMVSGLPEVLCIEDGERLSFILNPDDL